MSVRTRLTLWNVVILAVLLIGMGTILRFQMRGKLENALDAELLRRGLLIPPQPFRLPGPFPPGVKPPPIPLFDAKGQRYDKGGAAVDLTAIRLALRDNQKHLTTRGTLRVYTHPLRLTSGEPYFFQTWESRVPLERELTSLTRELLVLLPVGLLAAGIGGLFLTERALRPIRAITEAASKIEATALSERLPVHGKDELARLAMTFNEMLGRLERAFERQRQFTADASHELKTPLTIIQGAAELGHADPEASEKSRRLFRRVRDASERTTRLVQNLLFLARSDSGALPLHRQTIPIRALFDVVVEEQSQLPTPSAPLSVVATDETLYGDPELLLQLLRNLTENALRHTPPEGRVTLTAHPEGFSIADTGTGIAPEHLAHLTERFWRADSGRGRKAGGSGLGLAICQGIVDLHEGTLTFTSQPGEGTVAQVTLGRDSVVKSR